MAGIQESLHSSDDWEVVQSMKKEYSIIDCDVHNQIRGPQSLLPYFKEPWRSRVEQFGFQMGNTYQSPIGFLRKDDIPPGGGVPGSDPDYLVKQLLDKYNMEYGILTSELVHISALPDPDYAAAFASAYNDYLIDYWLPKSPRFKGAMLIATQDPIQAAWEIDRIGSHPDIVEVRIAGASRMPFGQRFYHPIYEAAQRNGLPIGIHPGSEGSGISVPPTAAGYPTNYFQWHTCLSQTLMAHCVSLICDGVFAKFPALKIAFIEGGIGWLPHLMWRMDKNYKALRATAPWLTKMPSQYIRDHCMLATQPVEEPDNPKHLDYLFEMIDAENMLMFASDYPHWDNDSPTAIYRRLSPEAKHKIFYANAKAFYHL
jgi:predicted TIM-barrel fold metal-dependent hydrolase